MYDNWNVALQLEGFDVYDWDVSQDEPVGRILAIETEQTGAEHYDYYDSSAHPAGVNLAEERSNIWIHEETGTGEYSFGFVFSEEGGEGPGNSAFVSFSIAGGDPSPYMSQSDDFGEAVEFLPDSNGFMGFYSYEDDTDGICVSGITGEDWVIIIDEVEFGNVQQWWAASGEAPGLADDLPLVMGHEYRIVPVGRTPDVEPSDPLTHITPKTPEPPDGATEVPVDTALSWIVDEPFGLTYSVRLGIDDAPPVVASLLADPFFEPTTLDFNTTYHWRATSFSEMDIAEGDLWSFTTVGLPDLTVVDPYAPDFAAVGELISVSWRTENQGEAVTPAAWTEKLLLSSDEQLDVGDTELFSVTETDELAPGEGRDHSVQVQIPPLLVGDYHLFLVIDTNEAFSEEDQWNNVGVFPLTIADPDLTITAEAPEAVSPDVPFRVHWTVTNEGNDFLILAGTLANRGNQADVELLPEPEGQRRRPRAGDRPQCVPDRYQHDQFLDRPGAVCRQLQSAIYPG